VTDTERGRILLLEDDAEMRDVVAAALEEEGYDVVAHARARGGERVLRAGGVAAVILDVWLPDGNGIDLCRGWRQSGLDVPVLMLTARTDVGSRVAGLDAGADDYLGKPFALAELRARLRALLRRGPHSTEERVLRHADVVVDFHRRQAWVAGAEVPVTRREIEVLERLARSRGRAVAREDLLEQVWGDATQEAAGSLEVIVARLRRKLEREKRGTLIRTVRGFGYALVTQDGGPK
jgi:two-component system, OmpR family, response regulator